MAPNSCNNSASRKHDKRNKKKSSSSRRRRSSSSSSKPIIPPPHEMMMKSRKRARQVTTLFHKYTREKDEVMKKLKGAEGGNQQDKKKDKEKERAILITELDEKIQAIGGRKAYQQASQLSTSFHSTSKWVLGYLQRNGWLYGIPIYDENDEKDEMEDHNAVDSADNNNNNDKSKRKKRKHLMKRDTELLEVGAINTELLDASERRTTTTTTAAAAAAAAATAEEGGNNNNQCNDTTTNNNKKYRLQVRAIDLHSMHPGRIEEGDFLKLPLPKRNTTNNHNNKQQQDRYDVIVNSMVLNCVTTPEDRGEMITRLYQFLRPGGILFLTIPRLCLNQSPFINRNQFLELLGSSGVGFVILETKESPKVAFFVCRRPITSAGAGAGAQHKDNKNNNSNNNNDHKGIRKKEGLDNAEESASASSSFRRSSFDLKWTKLRRQRKEKKFRNQFAIILNRERCLEARNEHCTTTQT